jgi:hypothetical protein
MRDNIRTGIKLLVGYQDKIRQNIVVGFLFVSIGVLMTASAGGWDITNHLLNKPESFFSLPHAALYTGVGMVILGSIMTFRCQFNFEKTVSRNELNRGGRAHRALVLYIKYLKCFPLSVKLVVIGVLMLVSAGPFDFIWHSTFGLDGLLSPPHLVLTVGMALCSVGALLGIISTSCRPSYEYESDLKHNKSKNIVENETTNAASLENSTKREIYISRLYHETSYPVLIVLGILPIWLTISGLIHMMSLPFSDTPYFDFNPDPVVAVIIATLCFPFLIALILFSSHELTIYHNRVLDTGQRPAIARRHHEGTAFGTLSLTGMAFIVINIATSILPNEYLVSTLPFYIINFLPIFAADILLTKLSADSGKHNSINGKEKEIGKYLAGAILGLVFFTMYFPLITNTYNEVLPNPQPVWPSLTSTIFFRMLDDFIPFIMVPAMLMGVFGVFAASKILDRKEERPLLTAKPI